MEEQKNFSLSDEKLKNVSGGAGAASCNVVCGQCGAEGHIYTTCIVCGRTFVPQYKGQRKCAICESKLDDEDLLKVAGGANEIPPIHHCMYRCLKHTPPVHVPGQEGLTIYCPVCGAKMEEDRVNG